MFERALTRAAACVAMTATLAAVPGGRAAAGESQRLARAGVGYLARQQQANGSIPAFSPVGSTADAVVSMVAARRGSGAIRDALRYLARSAAAGRVDGVGLRAKVAMAAAAAGLDPRAFGGENLVASIRRAERASGRYGRSTAVYDHALAVLALQAAGIRASREAVAWLAAAQCRDGGWQYDQPSGARDDRHCVRRADPTDAFASDTNTTSLAVQALAARGSREPARDPFGFFEALRDRRFGGWGFTGGVETTDANSTALVLQAYAATGRRAPAGAIRALEALQYRRCGAWAYTWGEATGGRLRRTAPDTGATIAAILGVLLRPLPVRAREVSRRAPATPPC